MIVYVYQFILLPRSLLGIQNNDFVLSLEEATIVTRKYSSLKETQATYSLHSQ